MTIEQKCPKCEGRILENDRFCSKCGATRKDEESKQAANEPVSAGVETKGGGGSNFLLIFIATLIVGSAIGWVRYWIGFCVIFQGAASAGLIIWAFQSFRNAPPKGSEVSNGQAWGWSVILIPVYCAAQIAGLGIAQPWFEPGEYFLSILKGNSSEAVFGITRTTAFSGGFLWIFCNGLDAVIMLFILAIGIRDDNSKRSEADESPEEEDEPEVEK